MQDRVRTLETNLTIANADARTFASQAALEATLNALETMTARLDSMGAVVAGISSDVSVRLDAGMATIQAQ